MYALLIDDDKNSLYVLTQMLHMEGIDSIVVNDPSTLSQVLSHVTEIRIVFLDLEMPESNGYDVFQKLKADPRFLNVPVVACSVYSNEMSTTHELGFDSFIAKPINADRFPGQLHQILSGQSVWNP